MERNWATLASNARASKAPILATLELYKWYDNLTTDDRSRADEVFCEWVSSSDVAKQFDALAMVWKFRIRVAIPALEDLAIRLRSEKGPEARYLRLKALRIINSIQGGVSMDADPHAHD
jgi:hypothetical protein